MHRTGMIIVYFNLVREIVAVKFVGVCVCGRGAAYDSPTLSEMSSTLFNRGMNTQMGTRQRAEAVDKNILALQFALAEVHASTAALPNIVRLLEAKVAALERKVAELQGDAVAAPEAAVTTA